VREMPGIPLAARERLRAAANVWRAAVRSTFRNTGCLQIGCRTDSERVLKLVVAFPRVPLLACPAVRSESLGKTLLGKPAVAPIFKTRSQISMPAIEAVMKAARAPPIMDRNPYLAKSLRRVGARPPTPPIITAIEPKLANPHKA